MAISIVIADDHPLMLRGISDFLISQAYNVVASAEDGLSAYNAIVKHQPDIAILDIRMPNMTGLEVAEVCQKNNITTKIILFTYDKEETIYNQAKQLGVQGYLLKEFAIEEIDSCIKQVLSGTPYFGKSIEQYLDTSTVDTSILNSLTKTEIRILKLISQHKTSIEIADILGNSARTIEKHRSNIMVKLNLDKTYNALLIWVNNNKHILDKA